MEKLAEPQAARGQPIDATNSHDAHYEPNRFPIMCSPCPTCFSKFNKAFYAIFARPCWNANTATNNFSECWMSANGFAMMCFDFKIYFLSRLRQFETFSFVFQLFHSTLNFKRFYWYWHHWVAPTSLRLLVLETALRCWRNPSRDRLWQPDSRFFCSKSNQIYGPRLQLRKWDGRYSSDGAKSNPEMRERFANIIKRSKTVESK